MLYRFDKKQLFFYKLNLLKVILLLVSFISLVSFTSIEIGKYIGKKDSVVEYSEMERIIMINEADPFSKEKLVKMLKDLKIKQPHIVMAQSIVETGKWKSNIFLENNNLFGMKQAKSRVTTAKGTQNNHAYYNHWRESVYDYAFYQSRYLHSLKTEADYFQYLSASYAEDPDYINVLKGVIKKEGLSPL